MLPSVFQLCFESVEIFPVIKQSNDESPTAFSVNNGSSRQVIFSLSAKESPNFHVNVKNEVNWRLLRKCIGLRVMLQTQLFELVVKLGITLN